MENIIELIKKDLKSKMGKYKARSYYKYKPKKEVEEINTYSNGQIRTIKNETNCFLYTNYFRMLVNQKIDYLLAKEPELKISNSDLTVAVIGDMLEEGMLNAALDSTAWLHLYVENNKLDWVFVHDSEMIPIYDKYNKNIISVLRYFLIDEDTYRVETWTDTGVVIEIIRKDKIKSSEMACHYEEISYYQGEIESKEGKNLPFIPFIPLHNNKHKESDLEGVQDLIDIYNMINSGFVDNINLFQEAIVKLKGFTGNPEDLETIRKNMQQYKMVGIPSGGGDNADMEYMAVEIPVEARKTIIDILKDSIFQIGQGVDVNKLETGGNITNVVIKSRYSGLDMKANRTSKQLILFYEKFVDCINKFSNSTFDKEITFNKSMIFNESESIDNCLKSINLLDLETVLNNHPWVTNSKKILSKIKKEKEENFKKQQELMDQEEKQINTMQTKDL